MDADVVVQSLPPRRHHSGPRCATTVEIPLRWRDCCRCVNLSPRPDKRHCRRPVACWDVGSEHEGSDGNGDGDGEPKRRGLLTKETVCDVHVPERK